METVIDFLEQRELLLIFDNCEHLADACGSFIDEVLRLCSRTRVFATSREPLCVDREIAWRVPPLSLPDASGSIDSLMASEAVQLFVDRAAVSCPSFQLTTQNARAVTDICRRLDGMPLALEIAAARVAILSPEEIAARLDDALALLDNEGRTRGARRQTLSKALEWSYDTLSAKERLALASLTVFAGDFSLAAAESVCAGTEELEKTEVLTVVSRLVDKSMIVVVNHPGQTGTRFQLLQIMGQFVRKQVPASLSTVLPRLHTQFFVQLCQDMRPLINTARREECFAQIEREYSNLRASLEWSRSDCSGLHLGLRIAGAIWPYWTRRGHIREGLNWLQRLLTHDRNAPDEFRAPALAGAGALVQSVGDYKLALSYLGESVALSRKTNSPLELGIALYQFARVAYRDGEADESALALQESIDILRQGTPGWYLALALSEKGIRAMYDGRLDEAATLQDEAASIMRENEDLLGLTVPLRNLALLAIYQGKSGQAHCYCRDALAILRPLDEHWMVAYTLEIVATAMCLSGHYLEAAQLLGAAERLRRTAGTAWPKNRQSDYDRIVQTLRTSLSGEDFRRAWASGRAFSREEAIAAAMLPECIAQN
jgi:non-specific serine/threonine protein kinase